MKMILFFMMYKMSKTTKYIIAAFSIIILLLFIIPYLISLESYKETIISKVREQTGRELKIDGKMSFSILPCPKIEINKLKFASLPHSKAENLIEVETIEAKLALLPLLVGNIVVSNLELNKPAIYLEKLQSGKKTWELQTNNEENEVASASLPDASPNNTNPLRSLPFIIHDIRIKDGRLNYRDGDSVSDFQVDDLDVKIASADGPVDFSLSLGKDLILNGTIKELAEQIPLSLNAAILNDKISIDGSFDTKSNLFTGNMKAEGNLKNFGEVIPEGLRDQHSLTAKIDADKNKVLIKDVKLDMGAINGFGEITHDLNASESNVDLQLNPGNIKLHLSSGAQKHDHLGGRVKLTAGNLDAFIKALKVDSSKLPFALNSDLNLSADLICADESIMLKNTAFTLGKIQIKGEVGAKNWSDKLSVPYDLDIADADSLAKLLGQKLPVHLSNVHVKGETTFENEAIITDTKITAAKSIITSKGRINTNPGTKSNLNINAAGASLSQTLHELLFMPSNAALRAFNIDAQIEGDLASGKSLNVIIGKNGKSTLVISGETSHLNSKIDLTSGSGKPHFNVDLILSSLNLSKISSTNTVASPSASAQSSNHNSSGHWSRDKIDLAGLDSANGNIDIKIQKLTKDSLKFDNITLKSELNEGVLKVSSLNGSLYGGKIEGSGSVSGKGNRNVNFKTSLKGALLRNIVSSAQKIKVIDGTVDFSCDLNSHGNSEFDYVHNLQGNINLSGRDGKISGVDLHKITNAIKKPKDVGAVTQALQNSVGKGETPFGKILADVAVSKGIMNLTKCELTSDELSADVAGQINLPQYSLDTMATVNTGIKNIPPVKIHFYGSLDNPQHNMDTKAIMQYMVDHILKGALDSIKQGKMKPQDILNSVMGGSGDDGDSNSQNHDSKSDNQPSDAAGKMIQKGLDSLFN